MTCETGTSGSVPAATTRERRSRSVMIPSPSSPSVDDHARRAEVGHHACGLADRGVRACRARAAGGSARRPVAARGSTPARTRSSLVDASSSERVTYAGPPAAPAAAAPPPRGCGSRASPRPRPPRSPSAGPRASRRARTARPEPSRSSTRPSWTISTAPVRTTQTCSTGPAPCWKIAVPAGWNSTSAASATRATSAGSSESNGGWGARKSATSCKPVEIYQFLDTVRWREDTREQLDPALSEGGRNG